MYDDMSAPTGLARFARTVPARGRLFSTRGRVAGTVSTPEIEPVITESALYDTTDTCSAIDLPGAGGHAPLPGD
ncbi:conserved hypothetical protein [Nocardia seriolae]|nr:conserved hypothetical protein [Nocardia seriolae]